MSARTSGASRPETPVTTPSSAVTSKSHVSTPSQPRRIFNSSIGQRIAVAVYCKGIPGSVSLMNQNAGMT